MVHSDQQMLAAILIIIPVINATVFLKILIGLKSFASLDNSIHRRRLSRETRRAMQTGRAILHGKADCFHFFGSEMEW